MSGLLDPNEFCDGLFAALQAALPSDYVSLNQVASEPERNWSIVEPPLSDEHHATFYRLALQNPLAERFLRTRDGRPLRLSDIVTPAQFHATDIYREFYGPLQIEHQIAFALPSDDQHILAIAVVVAVNGAYDSAGHTGYPGAATPVGGGDNGLGGVSCPSGVVCQAVGSAFPPGANGSQAGAVVINNEVPASTQIVQEGPPGTDVGLAGVGCSVVGNCEAAGGSVLSSGGQFSNEEGLVVPLINGTPGAIQAIPGTNRLSALAYYPGTSSWVAVGSDSVPRGVVVTSNGINSAPSFTTAQTPPATGTVGSPYGPYTFAAARSPPPNYSATGNVPPGLTVNGLGVLSGRPTTPGTYTFNVVASNGISPDASTSVTISVSPAPGTGPGKPNPSASQPSASGPRYRDARKGHRRRGHGARLGLLRGCRRQLVHGHADADRGRDAQGQQGRRVQRQTQS